MIQRTIQVFILLIRFLLQSLVLRSFHVLLRYSFVIFFFHICLFDSICFQYSQVLIIFLLAKHSSVFLIWQFYFSIVFLSPLFVVIMAQFSMQNSISIPLLYILIACIRISCSFSFWQFCEFVASCAFPKYIIEWHHCYDK